MKPAGLLLLIPTGMVTLSIAGEISSGLVSRETKVLIREGLPAYQPPPPRTGSDNPEAAEPAPAPDVLVLPKMTVRELRLPRDAADHLMNRRDFNRKMENLYLDTIAADGPLNVILNSFTIPFLSPSKAARGRAIYRAREMDRLRHVIGVSQALDPDAERKFNQELDNSHTTRPAGIR